jgi:hypothetical protein
MPRERRARLTAAYQRLCSIGEPPVVLRHRLVYAWNLCNHLQLMFAVAVALMAQLVSLGPGTAADA